MINTTKDKGKDLMTLHDKEKRIIRNSGYQLGGISESLRCDLDFMSELVSKNAQWMEWGSDCLRNDKTFVLSAVQIDGKVFLGW